MNFYYHTDICDHCQRSKRWHVGKKSSGWTFHFQGYRFDDGSDQNIVSLADWARMFKTTPGILVDETERVIENPLEFLADLERPTKAQIELEDSPARRGPTSPRPNPRHEWRDPDGFAFYDGDFS